MLILIVTEPAAAEQILTKLSPIIYTIIGCVAFGVFIKGMYKGEKLKTIVAQMVLCAVMAAIAYKPSLFLEFGNRLIEFIIVFSSYFA